MTHTEQTKLEALMTASNKAWKLACKSGLGLDDKAWQIAADAEASFRTEIGEDYATKFEDCYGYQGRRH